MTALGCLYLSTLSSRMHNITSKQPADSFLIIYGMGDNDEHQPQDFACSVLFRYAERIQGLDI